MVKCSLSSGRKHTKSGDRSKFWIVSSEDPPQYVKFKKKILNSFL